MRRVRRNNASKSSVMPSNFIVCSHKTTKPRLHIDVCKSSCMLKDTCENFESYMKQNGGER
jgi:hypothetical protein